jgi:hypothetical protein
MRDTDADALIPGMDKDPFPEFSRKRRRGVRVTSAAALALGLALSGGAVAAAAAPPASSTGSSSSSPPSGRPTMSGSPPAAFGTVKSVGDGTFTLTAQDGTVVTVDVGSSTTYRDPGVTSPSLADVIVGKHVAVFGSETSDVVTATSVAIGNPPAAGGSGGFGGFGGAGPRGPGGSGGTPPNWGGSSSSS